MYKFIILFIINIILYSIIVYISNLFINLFLNDFNISNNINWIKKFIFLIILVIISSIITTINIYDNSYVKISNDNSIKGFFMSYNSKIPVNFRRFNSNEEKREAIKKEKELQERKDKFLSKVEIVDVSEIGIEIYKVNFRFIKNKKNIYSEVNISNEYAAEVSFEKLNAEEDIISSLYDEEKYWLKHFVIAASVQYKMKKLEEKNKQINSLRNSIREQYL